jgi:transcriptional regulator with XRE-family HTH domain
VVDERGTLAGNLRRLRAERGVAAAELARRAGTSRATLSQLEAGEGNPTLDTLYALATALDASLADLIAPPPAAEPPRVVRAGEGARVRGDAVEAWLLDTVSGRQGSTEVYELRLHGSARQRSAGHPPGTREHLHLYAGRAVVGPAEAPVELGPGDFATFTATGDHVYQRLSGAVRGVLVITRT